MDARAKPLSKAGRIYQRCCWLRCGCRALGARAFERRFASANSRHAAEPSHTSNDANAPPLQQCFSNLRLSVVARGAGAFGNSCDQPMRPRSREDWSRHRRRPIISPEPAPRYPPPGPPRRRTLRPRCLSRNSPEPQYSLIRAGAPHARAGRSGPTSDAIERLSASGTVMASSRPGRAPGGIERGQWRCRGAIT